MQHLLLLHGAIGSSAQLQSLAEELKPGYQVHLFDFPGHGGKELPAAFSIPFFADSVLEYLDENRITSITIFGYSMGGYVAMYLARHFPDRVEQVITLATKFEWDPIIAEKEMKMLRPDVIEQKLPAFAETLSSRHAPGEWKEVLLKTASMLARLGEDNIIKAIEYSTIETPCLIMVGDRDKMVSIGETVAIYRDLPAAQLAVLPGTPHPIEQVSLALLCDHINFFLSRKM